MKLSFSKVATLAATGASVFGYAGGESCCDSTQDFWRVKFFSNKRSNADSGTGDIDIYLAYNDPHCAYEEDQYYESGTTHKKTIAKLAGTSARYSNKGIWETDELVIQPDQDAVPGGAWGCTSQSAINGLHPNKNANQLSLIVCNSSGNGFYIDKLMLQHGGCGSTGYFMGIKFGNPYCFWDTKETWGITNDKGWCLSTQSSDSFGDNCDAAYECIQFDASNGSNLKGADRPHNPVKPKYCWNCD